jgi:hypothetical protein
MQLTYPSLSSRFALAGTPPKICVMVDAFHSISIHVLIDRKKQIVALNLTGGCPAQVQIASGGRATFFQCIEDLNA